MQTFLPSSNIVESAKVLDNKRLNKQILEGYQILKVLSGASPSGAWRNHPAVLMWKGHEHALKLYIMAMVHEANFRGIKTENNVANLRELEAQYGHLWGNNMPAWFRDTDKLMRVVTTHKANLFKKDPLFYARFQAALSSPYNTPCCEGCKYYWVTHIERKQNAGK